MSKFECATGAPIGSLKGFTVTLSRISAAAALLLSSQSALAADHEPGPNPTAETNLICMGAGSATRPSSVGLLNLQRDADFEDQVTLWLEGENGSLRMPRSMLPRIRGGVDGWFNLSDVEVSDREITGTIRVSILNKPKLRLDRYTGAISISGKSGDYNGQCEKFDPAEVERAF